VDIDNKSHMPSRTGVHGLCCQRETLDAEVNLNEGSIDNSVPSFFAGAHHIVVHGGQFFNIVGNGHLDASPPESILQMLEAQIHHCGSDMPVPDHGRRHESPSADYIAFDGAINFDLGEMTQVAIEGDAHFGDVVILPTTGEMPQTQIPRNTPRKVTLFKNPQDFRVASADFVSVAGNAYGIPTSTSKFRSHRGVQRHRRTA